MGMGYFIFKADSKKEQSIVKTADDDILYYELLTLFYEKRCTSPKNYTGLDRRL